MNSTLEFGLVETGIGWIGLALSRDGLKATTLPRDTRDGALQDLMELGAEEPAPEARFGDLPERIKALASGRYADLSVRIDWAGITAFRRSVMEECMRIPAGETRSYGWLAAKVGRPGAARAVGRVMATNPFPLLMPCHRVVGSDGSLHGYGGGLEMKAKLLQMEGARP